MYNFKHIMKKIILICIVALATAFTSCETAEKFSQGCSVIDYSAFPGMFLTESNSVNFEYQPIASLYAHELTGQYKVVKKKVQTDDIYNDEYEVTEGHMRYANPQSALAYAAQKAREMGGNGIINLRIVKIDRGYSVTGMVIKR